MNRLITPEDEAHWYWPDGRPCYEFPKVDGSGMRATNVTDAKKHGLLPSVTSILSVLHKPALAAWINQQYVMAALTLSKLEAESLDDFATRVVQDARTTSRAASEYGVKIHTLVEWYLSTKYSIPPERDWPLFGGSDQLVLEGLEAWLEKNPIVPIELELCVADSTWGVAGRLDCFAHLPPQYDGIQAVIDWKTQTTTEVHQGKRRSRAIRFYPEWGPQLAAYGRILKSLGMCEETPAGLSVVISSDEPGRVEAHLWKEEWHPWMMPVFEACKTIFYSPVGRGLEG